MSQTYKTETENGLSAKAAAEALRRNEVVTRESDGAVCRLAGATRAKSPYAVRRWVGGQLVALTADQVARVAQTNERIANAGPASPMTKDQDRQLAADCGWISEESR